MKEKLQVHVQTEVDASFLYLSLSQATEDETLANIYREMAKIEETHARKMSQKSAPGQQEPSLPGPSARARMLVRLAKVFGWNIVLSSLMSTEQKMARTDVQTKKVRGESVTGQEFNHVRILSNLKSSDNGVKGGILAKLERRHKSVGGNALRAAVLGGNDGLVTNMSLIMGVAGASSNNGAIIVAGVAGLMAGAFSMALGEWLSVQSSRELNQRQIDIEIAEFENSPEEEQVELALIYQSKGVEKSKAEEMARQVLENKETAVDTLVREELGLDIEELGGSAWEAAFTSFLLFAIGAFIPLLPFLFLQNFYPVLISLGLSTLTLFGTGAIITLFTGKSIWYSGMRQVIFGLLAAAATFGIGKLIGVSVS
ncbi:MAG: VIT1/CCC1 transporter family protein [bacterium]